MTREHAWEWADATVPIDALRQTLWDLINDDARVVQKTGFGGIKERAILGQFIDALLERLEEAEGPVQVDGEEQ